MTTVIKHFEITNTFIWEFLFICNNYVILVVVSCSIVFKTRWKMLFSGDRSLSSQHRKITLLQLVMKYNILYMY